MQKKIDISVLDKKVNFSIPPFFWIHPKNIYGFSKIQTRKENTQEILNEDSDLSNLNRADFIIAIYLEECLELHPEDYQIFLDNILWIITELYSTYASNLSSVYLRPHLPKETKILNKIFEKIFDLISIKKTERDYFCLFLLKNFIFELFQFGPEWGVFSRDRLNYSSLFQDNIAIDDIKNPYLCSFLNKENMKKISSLLDIDFLDIFLNSE